MVNGQTIEGLQMDDTHSFKDYYWRMFFLSSMIFGSNKTCSLTFQDFNDNATIICYDLSASLNSTPAPLLNLVKAGSHNFHVTLDRTSSIPLSVLSLAEVQTRMIIDANGTVKIDSI